MRQQISISRGTRAVWRDAKEAAKDDNRTLSDVVTEAVSDWLRRRARRRRGDEAQSLDERSTEKAVSR